MTTTYCTAADLLSYMRQWEYARVLDTDDDGNADVAQITFHIEQGAIKLNHFNTNFSTDSKKAANIAFAAESIYNSPRFAGHIPAGIQSSIDFWATQCETHSSVATQPCQIYNPEEYPTQDYLDELLEEPS